MNLTQGYSSGGSVNSAYNQSGSNSVSNSWTDAMSARQWSALQADIAWQRTLSAMDTQMNFNAEEARKQREWQEKMANTVYTRSVANMREAGINPILAANMGLSGAAVGSGATASIGGSPSAPLAQSFMDSWSASNANGWGMGESHGNSWNNSENGLVTALEALGSMVTGAMGALSSGMKIDFSLEGLKDILEKTYDPYVGDTVEKIKDIGQSVKEGVQNTITKMHGHQNNQYIGGGGGHGFGDKWNYGGWNYNSIK